MLQVMKPMPSPGQGSPDFRATLGLKGSLRRRGRRGPAYTLVEIMIVVAIIGTLASLAIPAFIHVTYRAQVTRAIVDLTTLETEIDIFEFQNGRTPVDLNEINRS